MMGAMAFESFYRYLMSGNGEYVPVTLIDDEVDVLYVGILHNGVEIVPSEFSRWAIETHGQHLDMDCISSQGRMQCWRQMWSDVGKKMS